MEEHREKPLADSPAPHAASVTVTAPARLHLGFLDPSGGLGRRFASIGLAIAEQGTRIHIRSAASAHVEGADHGRVAQHIETMRRHLRLNGNYAVRVDQTVPAHAGLGSGTQLALAVAAGLRRLHDLPLDLMGDAVRLERGGRSGIGIGVFERGGLILDGGRGPDATAPPVISRLAFPEHWRVILVLDPSRSGVHGAEEDAGFASLPPFPAEEAAHHCRLILMKALPAVAEGDLVSFGAAIRELQARIGDYFAPIQGGSRFTSPDVAAALARLDAAGAHGVGQSSWGPTGFAFASSLQEAERLIAMLREDARVRALDIRAVAGLNRGAQIDSRPALDARTG
jgi:beta-ribofuranosylaminobenzene 5'-phosphate synthase